MKSTSMAESPTDDDLKHLLDNTKHYIVNGKSLPEYKVLVDEKGNEQVTLTVNVVDMRKIAHLDESRYVSVEEAKANSKKNAEDVMSALCQAYIHNSSTNERNTLMAIYQGIGISEDKIITDLKNKFEDISFLVHEKEILALSQLEQDINNFKNSRTNNVPRFHYDVIQKAFPMGEGQEYLEE